MLTDGKLTACDECIVNCEQEHLPLKYYKS